MVSTQMDLGIDLSGFGNIRFSFFEYFLRKTKTKTTCARELESHITRFLGHFLRFISVYRNMTSQIESWKKNIHRQVKKEKSQEVINSLARDESFLELETDRN